MENIPKLENLTTSKEYEDAFRFMWKWMADKTRELNRPVTKYEFFKEFNVTNRPECDCYACAYAMDRRRDHYVETGELPSFCKFCPVKWGEYSEKCLGVYTDYGKWSQCISRYEIDPFKFKSDEAAKYAENISKLLWEDK